MSSFRNTNTYFNYDQISVDAGGRLRTSGLTTLLDGKLTNGNSSLIFDSKGTGTGTLANNKYDMSVASGQYQIWQSKQHLMYSSGKSQIYEETFDNFAPQANVIKRFGGFTSNAAGNYDSNFDGFYIESSAGTIKLVVINEDDGTPNLNLDITSWSGYADLGEYKTLSTWNNFTVVIFDYLWLGGAILRVWLKTAAGFKLAHIYHYSGTRANTMMKFPCKPVRYEIRSSTGSGNFRYICSTVSSEGDVEKSGYTRTLRTAHTGMSLTAVGTVYPIMGIRKQVAYRSSPITLEDFGVFVNSTSDILEYSIQVNPILSVGGVSWANVPNSGLMSYIGTGTIATTVVTEGEVLAAGFLTQNSILPTQLLKQNFYNFLGSTIDNTMDEYILCGKPVSATVTTLATLTFKEF